MNDPASTAAPVFYDPSGRRRRRFGLAVMAFVALVLLSVGAFVVSVGAVATGPLLPFRVGRPQATGLPPPHEREAHTRPRRGDGSVQRFFARNADRTANPALAIAFHAPWDDSSAASLQRHVEQLDWVVPGWLSLTGADHRLSEIPDAAGHAIIDHAQHRPLVVPMVQNVTNNVWDGAGTAALLADPNARTALIDRLVAYLQATRGNGIFFDLETLPATAQPGYLALLRETKARFAPRGWIVALAVPVGDPDWNVAAFAQVADKVCLMAYDEHETGGAAGPIASQRWFERVVADAARGVPRDRLIVAIGSYAYDWHGDGGDALDVEEAWQAARDSGTIPVWDRASGNSSFAYEEGGTRHQVWLLDAASAYNQMQFLRRAGIGSVALWRMGSEDPGIWSILGRDHRKLPPPQAIEAIPPGTNVDIEGAGEILRIAGVPLPGVRRTTPGADGSIADVAFARLPSPYVVARTGARAKQIALTFDDGPDPTWTPRVLDVLKRMQVPATFFVIGDNALTERSLLTREVAEGHEVGSHTYTHPNLAKVSPGQVKFELNTTQRLFQAFTGHSLRLFRAPYFGDAEPSTADELVPVLEAQNRGYTSVGLHVDPADWTRPGVDQIVERTIAGVQSATPDRSANIVLLHDSGGDRGQTVAALPIIITRLRAMGYTFVPVSTLAGLSRDQAMPPISASDRVAATADLALFGALGLIVTITGWLFLAAISIGILRAIALSALALLQARREQRTVFPAIDPTRFVTVLIPAFNEESVIERAVRTVLASRDVTLEVIVIDDGSTDATSAVVAAAFGDDRRVRLLTLENGGKARALNRGLGMASGEIVVALDADTQFETATIARLARWFADAALGAVAGNAKVGNRVNLVTRWQALEYITAQNLERRALARLSAITVVPGAVGAWRLAAIRSVGGYPHDTLAEDQDLTIAIQRAGWRVTYDQNAVAWTESPETFRGLAKQRFRWAFGTLQCLYKHKAAMFGRPRGLGWVGLPQAVVFQIALAAISPIIDFALILSFVGTWISVMAHGWAQTQGNVELMLTYWLVFTAIDLLAAVIAFALERRERWGLLWLLIPQRIGYRQVMYYVVLKALAQAMRGPMIGWGKLPRTGRVAEREGEAG